MGDSPAKAGEPDRNLMRMRSVKCCPSGHRGVNGSTTKRGETPEEKRGQVDPPHGGPGARAHQRGRWHDQSPLRLRVYMDGLASLATIPPLAALREARLNGLPGVLAVVRRHRIGGSRRRVSDTSPTGLSDASKVGEPAYPPWPHSVCLPEGLAGGCAPSDPQHHNGAR